MMNLDGDSIYDNAVIEITKPLSHMSLDYYYQAVPYWKTKENLIFVKKGSSGSKMISTDNIKVLKVFKRGDEDEMEAYLKTLRNQKNI